MKAAVMEAVRKPLVVQDVQDPKCPPNGVIIRAEAEGVCRSDWHAWSGDWAWIGLVPPMPLVMGHEFCGVVEEVGKDPELQERRPRAGAVQPGRRHLRILPQRQLARLRESDVARLFLLGRLWRLRRRAECRLEPRADAGRGRLPRRRFAGLPLHDLVPRGGRSRAGPPGEWVAVHGCGGIGLSAIHVAAAIGANVIAVDLDDAKLELAKKIGAQHVINGKKTDASTAIVDLTKGGAHVGVDALGVKATCQNCDPVPAQTGPLAANRPDHGGRKGRSRGAHRSHGHDGVAAHRFARHAGQSLSLDVADGQRQEAQSEVDDH